MKISYFIIGLLLLVLAYLLYINFRKDKPDPPDTSRETELVGEINKLKLKDSILTAQNDSLKSLRQKIKTQIVYREREIDANILEDSSNSIVEYRRSLQDNNEVVEGTEGLTFREIGLGAKLMSKLPKLELTIEIQDSIISNQEIIIADKDFTIDSYREVCKIKDLSTQYWMEMYKDESAWYNENWIWLTLGVVVTGGIAIAVGQ